MSRLLIRNSDDYQPRLRWESARERRDRRVLEYLLAAGLPAPISDANRWLITGPDTMAKSSRTTLHALLMFHRYVREDVMDMSRERWLETYPPGFDRFLKYEYHHKKIVRALDKTSPFMQLLPKSDHFFGAPSA